MTDTNRPQISTSEDMLSHLPYQLTEGVTATREGLYFRGNSNAKVSLSPAILLDDPHNGRHGDYWLRWPDARKRLQYKDGKPWCATYQDNEFIVFWPSRIDAGNDNALHRLAAILCDDADGFRILHACIEEFGDDQQNP